MYKLSHQVLDGNLLKLEFFVMLGHDAARLFSAQNRAVSCRAIIITHLNIYLKAPFLSVLLYVAYARPHR